MTSVNHTEQDQLVMMAILYLLILLNVSMLMWCDGLLAGWVIVIVPVYIVASIFRLRLADFFVWILQCS